MTSRKKYIFTPGDIFEFSCAKGLCYGQYMMNKPGRVYQGGVAGLQILRIIDRCWAHRPENLEEIANAPTLYYFQGQLALELRDKIVTFIGNAPLPETEQAMPVFRAGFPDPKNDGKTVRGVLIIGEERVLVPQFGPEHFKLSEDYIAQIASAKHKIERGWRPELDCSVVGISQSVLRDPPDPAKLASSPSPEPTRTHYLYFKTKPKADAFVREAKAIGHEVALERAEESRRWLVLVTESNLQQGVEADLADVLIELAETHSGEYDGSETGPLA